MRNISPEGEICCFLCSACNITHVVSTVNRWVLIFCKDFVKPWFNGLHRDFSLTFALVFLDLTTFVPIIINAIPYNTFIHCIFNFIQALLSYEGLGHFTTSNFTGQNTEVGTRFLCLLWKFYPLLSITTGSPFLPKESKEKPCNSSLSVCFQYYIDNNVLVVYNVYVVTSH